MRYLLALACLNPHSMSLSQHIMSLAHRSQINSRNQTFFELCQSKTTLPKFSIEIGRKFFRPLCEDFDCILDL